MKEIFKNLQRIIFFRKKKMSPLIIVGILISTALADVSHVLQGTAKPPADPNEINGLAPANGQNFWWMDSNSPFKQAYDEFKKCSSKGNCLTSNNVVPEGDAKAAAAAGANNFGPNDLKKNPFLNGQYESGSVSSSFASSFSSSSKTDVPAFHSGAKIDISNNPFLKGQFATAGELNFLAVDLNISSTIFLIIGASKCLEVCTSYSESIITHGVRIKQNLEEFSDKQHCLQYFRPFLLSMFLR